MANVTKEPDVTEVRVVSHGNVIIELSHEEANRLAMLLRGGVGLSTIGVLGLSDLMDQLKNLGLGIEANPRDWQKWTATAQRSIL